MPSNASFAEGDERRLGRRVSRVAVWAAYSGVARVEAGARHALGRRVAPLLSRLLDLTFFFDGQTFTSPATKGSAPSAITCTISAAQDGFTLSVVAPGTIVHNG